MFSTADYFTEPEIAFKGTFSIDSEMCCEPAEDLDVIVLHDIDNGCFDLCWEYDLADRKVSFTDMPTVDDMCRAIERVESGRGSIVVSER